MDFSNPHHPTESKVPDLPLSWYLTQNQKPAFTSIPLLFSRARWLALAAIPVGDSRWSDFELPGQPNYNNIIRGCRSNTAAFLEKQGWQVIPNGIEAILTNDPAILERPSLRDLIRRGRRHGKVEELPPTPLNLQRFSDFQQHVRHGKEPRLRHLFHQSWEKEFRVFVFRSSQGRWLGAIMLSPGLRVSWHTEIILRMPNAPVGVMEALIATIHLQFYQEGVAAWSLGEVPFQNPDGAQNTYSRMVAKVGEMTRFVYNAEGLFQFKNKFRPDWQPLFLCASHGMDWRVFSDLMSKCGYWQLMRYRLGSFFVAK